MKNKIKSFFWDITTEYAMNKLCSTYNIQYGGMLAINIITGMINPIDLVIKVVAIKIGINPLIVGLVVAFLL